MTYSPLAQLAPTLAPDPSQYPVAPVAPVNSLIEQINTGLANASANYLPLSIPGVGSNQAIVPGLPSALTALERKYTTNLPQLQDAIATGTISPEALNVLQSFDAARAQRGQTPLNNPQSAGALQTVTTGQAATPEADRNVFNVLGNAGQDLKAITLSVPHLLDPRTWIHEAQGITHIPSAISEADNPVEGFFQAPGIRLIPGAYTLGNIAGGKEGIHEALTHPLMTSLDVYGADALLGKAAGLEHGGLVGKTISESEPGQALTGWRKEFTESIGRTRGGQWLKASFGERARASSKVVNFMANQMHIALDASNKARPTFIDPEGMLTDLTRGAMASVEKWSDQITPQRVVEITDIMEHDPKLITDPLESAFVADMMGHIDSLTQYHLARGDMQELIVNGQAEIYTPKQAREITKKWRARDRYAAFTPIREAVKRPELATPEFIEAIKPDVLAFLRDERFTGTEKVSLARGYGHVIRSIDGTLPEGYRAAIGANDINAAAAMIETHTPTFDLPLTKRERGMMRDWRVRADKYTPGKLNKRIESATRQETLTLPARWRTINEELISGKVKDKIELASRSSSVDVSAYVEQALNRDYHRAVADGLISGDDIKLFREEAAATIAEMKRNGLADPVFIHRVDPTQVHAISYPQPGRGTIQGKVVKPSQVKETSLMPTPYVHDVTVALSHEAQQLLQQAAEKSIYSEILRTVPKPGETVAPFARTYAELLNQYDGVIRAKTAFNPGLDARGIMENRINVEWKKFPIDQLSPELKRDLGLIDEMGENHPYVPRSVWKNLERFSKPAEIPALDRLLHAFRTSLLVLSPRFVLYQIIGDAVQMMAQTEPLAIWKEIGRGREMIRENKLPETLRPILGHVIDPALEWQFRSGTMLSRMLPEDSPFKSLAEKRPMQAMSKATYSAVSFFSDTYLAMTYLFGYDKAITKGLTNAQAISAGETLARKALMTWDDMTAFERTSMRYIFPFYGFAQHMLRYAAKYPIDHPFRAAVTASIARNELNDLGTGLPQNMLNMIFLGKPDSHGHVRTINTAGMNPFRDVSNMTTLAGWLNATNPAISGILQSAGLDVQSGGPDLYPQLTYDPETGHLAAKTINPLLSTLYQTAPQTQLVAGLINKGSEFRTLMRDNPSAAMRLIGSQAGIPLSILDQNVGKRQIQGEVARQEAAATTYSTALKTGDYTEAMRWPTLRAPLMQVNALKQSGALSQFMPGGSNSQQKLDQIAQMIGSVNR